MKRQPEVGVYMDGHWLTTVQFKNKWVAYAFHVLLNMSSSHRGTRNY